MSSRLLFQSTFRHCGSVETWDNNYCSAGLMCKLCACRHRGETRRGLFTSAPYGCSNRGLSERTSTELQPCESVPSVNFLNSLARQNAPLVRGAGLLQKGICCNIAGAPAYNHLCRSPCCLSCCRLQPNQLSAVPRHSTTVTGFSALVCPQPWRWTSTTRRKYASPSWSGRLHSCRILL